MYLFDRPSVRTKRLDTEIDRQGRTAANTSVDVRGLQGKQSYLAARGKLLSLSENAFVIVDIILPTMLSSSNVVSHWPSLEQEIDLCEGHSLVLIGKSRVKACNTSY